MSVKCQKARQITHIYLGNVFIVALKFIYLLGDIEQKINLLLCKQVFCLMTKNNLVILLSEVIKINFSKPVQE
jgi:hypothetical protein